LHKCTAGCQPADVIALILSSFADSTTGWQPVVRFKPLTKLPETLLVPLS